MMRILAAILLLAGAAESATSGSFLATRASQQAAARAAVEGHIYSAADVLRQALLNEYSADRVRRGRAFAAQAARARLAALARRYRRSYGPEASLMSRYVLPSLPGLLYAQPANWLWQQPQYASPMSALYDTPTVSQSSESVYQSSNGDGQGVVRTTRCKDGLCEQRTEYSTPEGQEEEEEAVPAFASERLAAAPQLMADSDTLMAMPTTVSQSSESVYQSSNGRGQGVVRTTRCRDGLCQQQTEYSGAPPAREEEEEAPAAFVTGEGLGADESGAAADELDEEGEVGVSHGGSDAVEDAAVGMMRAFRGATDSALGYGGLESMLGNIFGRIGQAAAAALSTNATGNASDFMMSNATSHSFSSQSVFRDGKMVTVKRECINGNCTTTEENQTVPLDRQEEGSNTTL